MEDRGVNIKGERGHRQGDPLSHFFFSLTVDALGRLVDRAKVGNEIMGLELGRDKFEVSHIQFADDTLFLVKDESHLRCLVEILNSFSQKSGWKINLEKKFFIGIVSIRRESGRDGDRGWVQKKRVANKVSRGSFWWKP